MCPRSTHSFIVRAPAWLPDIPASYRSLLEYFCHVTYSFSCDITVQTAFCQTFMPMAVETPHVMASMLALAASHRANAGLDQSSAQLALLHSVAAEKLRSSIASNVGRPTEGTLATILMLCLTDVVSQERKTNSWRLHLEGAASVLRQDSSGWTVRSQDPIKAFIAKCFVSLVALANFSPCAPSEAVSRQVLLMASDDSEAPHIDEFTAYSTSLVYVFAEAGSLLREQSEKGQSTQQIELRTRDLISQLRSKISLSNINQGTEHFGVSSAHRLDYARINESYHHAALIQIYLRIRKLEPSADEIQQAVRRILELLSRVEIVVGPCPGTVMLFPIFSAGCAAVKVSDQDQVRDILQAMLDRYKIANVQHCMKLLETLWFEQGSTSHSQAAPIWTAFIGKLMRPTLAIGPY